MILTDLDGTLLEGDGTLSGIAGQTLAALRARGVPVVPLTSKTRRELRHWIDAIGCGRTGAFENGAGILTDGGAEIFPEAVTVRRLSRVLAEIAPSLPFPVVAISALPDAELSAMTGLPLTALPAVRDREYDLPFFAPEDAEDALVQSLRAFPEIHITRGDRFWHLLGRHDKATAAYRLLASREASGPTIGLGDSPNDAGFLQLVDRPVVIPRESGPDPRLVALLPHALIAPAPAGAGWAAAIAILLEDAA